VIQGIDASTKAANTVNVTAEDYRHSIYPVVEPYIFDSGFMKLREARLSWEVPNSMAAKARVSSMNIALIGRNLFTSTKYPNYDPETAENAGNSGQGYEMGALPTTKSFGLSVTLTP
jgi:hypothetical protein